jgi:hypothetical protein
MVASFSKRKAKITRLNKENKITVPRLVNGIIIIIPFLYQGVLYLDHLDLYYDTTCSIYLDDIFRLSMLCQK